MEYGFYTNEVLQILTPETCKSQPIPRNPSSVENSKSGLYDPPPPLAQPYKLLSWPPTYIPIFASNPSPPPCLDWNVQGQFFLIWSCSWKGQLIFSVESSDEIWHNISLFIAKSDKVYIRTTSKKRNGRDNEG